MAKLQQTTRKIPETQRGTTPTGRQSGEYSSGNQFQQSDGKNGNIFTYVR
jgi:hypothetical protein